MNISENSNKKISEPRDKIIYSINIEDIQTVAMQELDRELTDEEIKSVEDLVGEYIDWYQAIHLAIIEKILNK